MTPEQYHDGSKHHFDRFAQSVAYLDWASQPNPFRSFVGAPLFPLYPAPGAAAAGYAPSAIHYDRLFAPPGEAVPLSAATVGDVLRHALGLSAWKQFRQSRWALRVNPSSGNLHPTEAYVVVGPMAGLADTAAVYHYAPDRHALEQRSAFESLAMSAASPAGAWLLALTSIHWREAWKYGERAFRYCQHDLGHAIAAVRLGAALVGWTATMLPEWSQAEIGTLVGIDRDEDYVEAEREEAACVLLVTGEPGMELDGAHLRDAVRRGRWFGRANQLSNDHVVWTFIDEIARATEDRGRHACPSGPEPTPALARCVSNSDRELDARQIIIQRRSAVAFDGLSSMGRSTFINMLARTMPAATAPWDALWWTPRIHLLLFVHRVEDMDPGLYLLPRDPSTADRLKAACGRDFLWQPVGDPLLLVCLAVGDCRRLAHRLSCDQDIAADGFFSLGMIADFDASLREHGPSFYRHLFWESGVVGQVLYLEAEAAGARATGIGCFYDDPVHDVLGLTGHAFQSLYHFTVGVPVEDARLMTEAGYRWESPGDAGHT